MRSKNAFKNLIFYLLHELCFFIASIIFPRFIILIYGSEINGLTSTISRVLALINLIQAGAVGAAIYQMYKPVAENDFDTQSAIIYSSKIFYKKIAILYMSLAIGIGLFYSFYLRSSALEWWEIFISFLILAINGTSILLITSVCDIFLSPHQKKYYLIVAQFANLIVHYGFLTLVLAFRLHFVFIYLAMLIGGFAGIFLSYFFYKKESKGRINKNPSNKNYKIPDKKYLMLQSVGNEAILAAPIIIISTLLGLTQSSVFSVYFMVFSSMKMILNSIQLSFSAIFGNLVKTSKDRKIHEVYDSIELLTIIVGTFCSFCVGFLIMPFVSIYTSGVEDANYNLPILGIFTTLFVVAFAFRTSFSFVATVYGLFKKTCYITLISTGIGILLSFAMVLSFGMPYVMIGLLINEVFTATATLMVLKKDVSWFTTRKLFNRSLMMCSSTVISLILFFVFEPQISNILERIIAAFLIATLSILMICLYCFVFEKEQIKILFGYLKSFLSKK